MSQPFTESIFSKKGNYVFEFDIIRDIYETWIIEN